ncbi:hypothetical protein H4R26_000479 [Coemansia thaxteri]|uniref:Uncharacterized protein n=1 Tax=Coemansia thaxteri TaxID=2663907 RepID=A0A9W8BNK2_9FUNG|nr:hypothetical protein H4R26_000479 [Coemansia thaxteri]
MENVVAKQSKEPKLRNRLMPHSRGSNNGNDTDASINRPIAYLTVLHGVVWSFPREMSTLFKDPETSVLLYKVITSTYIPVTVRETLLCMVSNWCILFRESLGARLNLEGVVDSIKEAINLRPSASLLRAPPIVREQATWSYPMAVTPNSPLGPYNPHGGLHQQQQAPPPSMQRPSTFSSAPPTDSVFLSQQQELISSQNAGLYASHAGVRTRNRPSSFRSASGQEPSDLAPEFIAHMETSAQELQSLCDILTETLISLNVEEDPSENPVVGDMVAGVKNRKAAVLNFIGMLNTSHEALLAKLTKVTDCVDRCLWLQDKTINSHNEWKAIQESLRTSAAEEARTRASSAMIGGSSSSSKGQLMSFSSECQPESSTAAARLYAVISNASGSGISTGSSSSNRNADYSGGQGAGLSYQADRESISAAAASGSNGGGYLDDRCSRPLPHTPAEPAQEMSSKARGKMAEVPSRHDLSDWDHHPSSNGNAYGGSSAYGDSAYGASGDSSSRHM